MENSWNGNGKIIFKQGVSKEEKIKFFSIISCVAIPYIAIIIINAMYQYDMKALIVFLLMCFFPLFVLTILMGMNYLEWYCIYDDRIEVRCPFGKKNVVYTQVDDRHFTVSVEIEISRQFFGWLLGFGKEVKIISPPEVREEFTAYIDKIREMY